MNKKHLLSLFLISVIFLCLVSSIYASWTEYKDARYIDLDGDFLPEIIIESKQGVGLGHYVEIMRIFKEDDKLEGLRRIFVITTLDSSFGGVLYKPDFDVISEVEFTEPDIKTGARDIIVKSRKIYYKDENKTIDKEMDLGTVIYKWDGENFKLAEKSSNDQGDSEDATISKN